MDDPLAGEDAPALTDDLLEQHPKLAERLLVVDAMLRKAYDHGHIQAALSREWQVDRRTIRRYIDHVHTLWRQRHAATEVDDAELARRGILDVIRLALDRKAPNGTPDPDVGRALRGWREFCHLSGLYVERHEVSGPHGTPLRMTFEDARDEIARKLDRLAAEGAPAAPVGEPEPSGS